MLSILLSRRMRPVPFGAVDNSSAAAARGRLGGDDEGEHMSFDIAVFDPAGAPRDVHRLQEWFEGTVRHD